jgi:hypothetical protein
MSPTYVKTIGATQTYISNNNNKRFNEVKWDADYDGNIANVYVKTNDDGHRQNYNIQLTNDDLENLLNVSPVNQPLERRLQTDFLNTNTIPIRPKKQYRKTPYVKYDIEDTPSNSERILSNMDNTNTLNNILSSPKTLEELIVPVSIQSIPTSRSHKTYKVYKKIKSKKNGSVTSRKKTPATKRHRRTKKTTITRRYTL